MNKKQKQIIEILSKLGYKVNTLVCKINEEWQKKEELDILVFNIEAIKLELKDYFMSLVTGNRVKVDFKIEDELNEKLQGYVIKAKGYVLKANKDFKRLSFILNSIFFKVKFLFTNFDLENWDLKIIRFDLGKVISNLNIILDKVTELFNIVSNLNTMILLSLKDQDKELHDEVNTNIINLRSLFDEIVNEVKVIGELNINSCVENITLLSLNVRPVDHIAMLVSRDRKQIWEMEQENNSNNFELFSNQVKNLVFPLEVLKDDKNIVSYLSDIFLKLDYIQREVNGDLKIKKELGDIVNDGLTEVREQLNLYIISKLKEQVKRVHVDFGYKFKELKIHITGLINYKDLIDLGEQSSLSTDFTDLNEFFINFNKRLWFYFESPFKHKYSSVNYFDILFSRLQTELHQFKILKIEELLKCLNRENKKNYKRQIYKEINEELFLYLKNEKYIENEKKEIKVYLVSPLGKFNNIKIDIDYSLNEVSVYIVSPLKSLKAELQAYMLFLLRHEIKILISKLIFFKEIQEVDVDGDVFFSMHELNYENKNMREEVKVEITNIITNIKKEIHDMFFPMDVQIHVDEDVKIFFAKIQTYKRIKASLRIQAKEEFAEFFEKTKAKHEIKDIIFKIYHLYNQLEELEIIVLYLINLNFFTLRKNIQIRFGKKMKI